MSLNKTIMEKHSLYLDNASTTALDPRVLEAMMPWLGAHFGNPSSVHGFGRSARVVVERAREHVAALLGAHPAEIIFTSGGTESDNAAIHSALASSGPDKPHVITSPAEHQAVLQVLNNRSDCGLSFLEIDSAAVPRFEALRKELRSDTNLIALMHANNETGGLLDLDDLSGMLGEFKGLLFSDMVQSAGKMGVDIHSTRVDLASLSAHKIHGPQGIGALYVRRGIEFESFMHGGSQERGRRGGTENVAGIVGFGEAARLAIDEQAGRTQHWRLLRMRLLEILLNGLPGIFVNGGENVLPNIVSVTLPYSRYPVDGAMLLMNLDLHGCALSAGSACTAGSVEPSHVMRAIGHSEADARSSLRFSFGAFTTIEMVDEAAELFVRLVQDMAVRSSERSHSRSAMP